MMDAESERAWGDFQSAGLLWLVNTILHLFGWAIVITKDDGRVVSAAPARVKFRGFAEDSNTAGYRKVTEYIAKNIDALVAETQE